MNSEDGLIYALSTKSHCYFHHTVPSLFTTGGNLVSVSDDTEAVSESFSLLLGVVGVMRGKLDSVLSASASKGFARVFGASIRSVCVPFCLVSISGGVIAAIFAGSDFEVRIVEELLAEVADAGPFLFNFLLLSGGKDLVPPRVCKFINFFCFHQGSSHNCSFRTSSPGILCLSQ